MEHVLIAAPVDTIELGMEFRKVPLHMTVIGWLAVRGSADRAALGHALHATFQGRPVYQDVIAVDRAMLGADRDQPATVLDNVERAPWGALYDVAAERKMFLPDDLWSDRFSPHIADLHGSVPVEPNRRRFVPRGERMAFDRVVVISKNPEAPEKKRVEAIYPLRKN